MSGVYGCGVFGLCREMCCVERGWLAGRLAVKMSCILADNRGGACNMIFLHRGLQCVDRHTISQ